MLLIHRRGGGVKTQQSGVVRVESLGGDVSTPHVSLQVSSGDGAAAALGGLDGPWRAIWRLPSL